MASHGVPRVSTASQLDKSDEATEKERKQIEQYKALEEDVIDRIKAKDFSNSTFQLTSALLKQNPEYYTIWNHRRRLLCDVFARELASGNSAVLDPELPPPSSHTVADAADAASATKAGLTLAQQEISLLITEDLAFLIPLLKQYPKCYWIWNHRAWLLAQATTHLPATHAVKLWQGELALVSKMLALDNRNFHGWGYRREVVGNIEALGRQSLREKEFEYTTKMIQTDLSNFSAWHYRAQLIPRLLKQRTSGREERRKFLDEEFELVTRGLYTDERDQSLWFYHQYLMSTLDSRNPATKRHCSRPGEATSSPILDPIDDADRVQYLDQQVESLRDMLDGAEEPKYILQNMLDYSKRYCELNGGNDGIVTSAEMKEWLEQLRKLDPLREGRWSDLETSLRQ